MEDRPTRRLIKIFISHATEDNDEAMLVEQILLRHGFKAYQFGSAGYGKPITEITAEIDSCEFFILIVSDIILESKKNKPRIVHRELGYAINLRDTRRSQRPIIIPWFRKGGKWRRNVNLVSSLLKIPTGNFGNDFLGVFEVDVRGHDIYGKKSIDSEKRLIDALSPHLAVSRFEFLDPEDLEESGAFDLYEKMFPEVERHSRAEILKWCYETETGEKIDFIIGDQSPITIWLDSRFFVTLLNRQAVAIAYLTYDHLSNFIAGNYLAVSTYWREGGRAKRFWERIEERIAVDFPGVKALLVPIEPVDTDLIRIACDLAKSGQITPIADLYIEEIKKFKRLLWYEQEMGCELFVDCISRQPMVYRSPCLTPNDSLENWSDGEQDYWLLYKNANNLIGNEPKNELFIECYKALALNVLAKSIAYEYRSEAVEYWDYACALVQQELNKTVGKRIGLEKTLNLRFRRLAEEVSKKFRAVRVYTEY